MTTDIYSFGIVFIVTFLCSTNRHFATLVTSTVVPYILYEGFRRDWRLFGYIKGISVLMPILLYANYYLVAGKGKFESLLLTSLLALNIIEPAIVVQLWDGEWVSVMNGILTVVLALYTPIITYDWAKPSIGFTHHSKWIIAYVFVLGSFYLFNDYYRQATGWVPWGVFSVVMPGVYSLLTGSTNLWVPLRAYSLFLSFFLMVNPTLASITMSANSVLTTNYMMFDDKYDAVRQVCLVAGVITTGLVVRDGASGTILGELTR